MEAACKNNVKNQVQQQQIKSAKLRGKLMTVLLEKFHCKQTFFHPDCVLQSVLVLFIVLCNTHYAEVNSSNSNCVFLQSPANITVQCIVKVNPRKITTKRYLSILICSLWIHLTFNWTTFPRLLGIWYGYQIQLQTGGNLEKAVSIY